MPHLFALQGPGNCGKSSTLILLSQTIQTKYPAATIENLYGKTKDIAVILRGVNGLTVGIESQGDPSSRLQKSLNTFASEKCDIIFCACRTSGMTVTWVNSMSNSYNIQFIKQTQVTTTYGSTNSATVTSLMRQAGI